MKKVIKRILSTGRQKIGEHYMHQPLPNHDFSSIDPFLLVHHHGPHEFLPYNQGLPFGPHPHRGFETLTFIYEGAIEHADSQGFKSVINPGGVQWMTAGRGIVHSENIPEIMRENGGKMEIIQLWMNLPGTLKMTAPNYQGFQKEQIPVIESSDGQINTQVISGELEKVDGPAKSLTELTIMNITANKSGKHTFLIPENENVLFYVLNGEVLVNGKLAINNQLVNFENKGEEVEIEAQENSRLIIAYGKPLKEPVESHGPFVMNTTTEIMQAMRDYKMGKMGVM